MKSEGILAVKIIEIDRQHKDKYTLSNLRESNEELSKIYFNN